MGLGVLGGPGLTGGCGRSSARGPGAGGDPEPPVGEGTQGVSPAPNTCGGSRGGGGAPGVTHRGQGVVTEGLGLLQKLRLWEGLRVLGEGIWVRRGRGRVLDPSPTPQVCPLPLTWLRTSRRAWPAERGRGRDRRGRRWVKGEGLRLGVGLPLPLLPSVGCPGWGRGEAGTHRGWGWGRVRAVHLWRGRGREALLCGMQMICKLHGN